MCSAQSIDARLTRTDCPHSMWVWGAHQLTTSSSGHPREIQVSDISRASMERVMAFEKREEIELTDVKLTRTQRGFIQMSPSPYPRKTSQR